MTAPTARYIVGDTRTVLRSMPDASVGVVLTSPPLVTLMEREVLPARPTIQRLDLRLDLGHPGAHLRPAHGSPASGAPCVDVRLRDEHAGVPAALAAPHE